MVIPDPGTDVTVTVTVSVSFACILVTVTVSLIVVLSPFSVIVTVFASGAGRVLVTAGGVGAV